MKMPQEVSNFLGHFFMVIGIILYQNFTYKAITKSIVTTIKTMVEGSTLNMLLSSSNALGLIFGPAKLIKIMTNIVKAKANPIQIKNGISKPPFPFGNAV